MNNKSEYNAFISYSHKTDEDTVSLFHKELQRFGKPLNKKTNLTIFKDNTHLSASASLWENIKKALINSDFFIIIASPDTAKSDSCLKEITYWIQNKEIDKIIIVLLDGDIAWDDNKKDFDWNKTTALPLLLSNNFMDEPLYVDIREHRGNFKKSLHVTKSILLEKIVRVAATLHRVTPNVLYGDEIIEQNKFKRSQFIFRIVLISLVFALVGFVIYLSVSQKHEHEQTIEIKRQNKIAVENEKNISIANIKLISQIKKADSLAQSEKHQRYIAEIETKNAKLQTDTANIERNHAILEKINVKLAYLLSQSKEYLQNNPTKAIRLSQYIHAARF